MSPCQCLPKPPAEIALQPITDQRTAAIKHVCMSKNTDVSNLSLEKKKGKKRQTVCRHWFSERNVYSAEKKKGTVLLVLHPKASVDERCQSQYFIFMS